MLKICCENVRKTVPLVHNITNYVTVNDVANVLLACGGSPIMSDEPEDVTDITSICSALNINIGTLHKTSIEAMLKAGKKSNELGHPVLLDPVGAGASALRTNTAVKLMKELKLTVIRGNISEIKTLALGSGTTKGVDADVADKVTDENLDDSIRFVKNFAKESGTIVAVTGAIDLVSDGEKCYVIRNGRPEMGQITGTGCQLSGMMTAYVTADPEHPLEAAAAARRIAELPGLLLEGLFTHFAVADEAEAGADYTKRQYQSFRLVADTLKGWGISIPFCHCSNSAGILDYPEMNFNLVRAGIILYGLQPSSKVRRPLDLRPLMELKSVVSMVKTVGSGVDVSYGRTYTTRGETKIATVPIGYADGYPRALSNLGEMLVRGQRARIIGRVCMDQLMLDVTHIPDVEEGDVVTVFGRDGGAFLPVEEVSSLDQTINYETVCQITKRVPRIYRGGKLGGIEKAGRPAR